MIQKILALILFTTLIVGCDDRYETKNGNVYYVIKPTFMAEHGGHGDEVLVKNADAESFDELEAGYGKDKNHVYLNGYLVKNANPQTFEIIDYRDENSYGDKNYSKDKNFVFFNGNQIPRANPKTFQILEEKPYSKDDKDYYFWNKPLNLSNINTFKLGLLKDNQYKSYCGNDSKHFYLDTLKFPIADYKTFEYIDEGFFTKDKINVYYLGEIVSEADPKTFYYDTISRNMRDKNFEYIVHLDKIEKLKLNNALNIK